MALAYIDGTPFWYNVAGDTGTPVILIMGFATRGNAWDIQIKGLEGDHQVMWYDHRGIGESGQPNPVFSMKDMARDVVGLMDEKQWRAAHIVRRLWSVQRTMLNVSELGCPWCLVGNSSIIFLSFTPAPRPWPVTHGHAEI